MSLATASVNVSVIEIFENIGLAIAERLGHEGAKLVISSRNQQNVDKALEHLRNSVGKRNLQCIHYGLQLPSADCCLWCHQTAIVGLTKALANSLASKKITVNCISPGIIKTNFSKALWDGLDDQPAVNDDAPDSQDKFIQPALGRLAGLRSVQVWLLSYVVRMPAI
uniref:Uncharacterized protein n=1 Tax=Ditylenchus dipsaci TaxID=166011 RepID=A0A915DXY0_9BILA